MINVTTCLALLDEGAAELSGAGGETPELDAQLLLSRTLGLDRTKMLVNPPSEIDPSKETAFRGFIRRRAAGEPVAYITGFKEFYKHAFMVNRSVLIPRPETEILVEETLRRFRAKTPLRLLDIGTGCGCIALSLAAERPDWEISAADISKDALTLAKENGKRLGVENVTFLQSDLFSDVEGKFDAIVSNPPYVDIKDRQSLQVEIRDYEPAAALFTTERGLRIIREIVKNAPLYLKPGGTLMCEIGFDQRRDVEKLFDKEIWSDINFHRDLAGHTRVVSAVSKGRAQ